MKVLKTVFLISVSLIVFGCSSTPKRGVIAMKLNDTVAHVAIGKNEVNIGDHLELYRNECTGLSGNREPVERSCEKKSFGHGEITQILNQDYATIKFQSGTQFAEGDMVEKHTH